MKFSFFFLMSSVTPISKLDVTNYKDIIREKVASMTWNGSILWGTFQNKLAVPRRGWLIRGIHPQIAETSLEHSQKLVSAAQSYAANQNSDISYDTLGAYLQVHDYIDSVFDDITPADGISVELKKEIEDFGMHELCKAIRNGRAHEILAHYSKFTHNRHRESVIGHWLDKQDAAVQAKWYQTQFHVIRDFYQTNPDKRTFLTHAQNQGDWEVALSGLYDSLTSFYLVNRQNFRESFMIDIADRVEAFQPSAVRPEKDVYEYYLNLLSTHDLN
jgi:5'-deoxynucleotidase YfbR-like HD superfamily hydrolase